MKSDAPGGFALKRYRQLVDDLRAGIEARQKREQELAELEADSADPAARQLAQELSRLQSRLEQELAEADEEHSQARSAVEERFQAEVAAAETEYRRSVHLLEHRYTSESAAVEKQYEENRWMMSSILDDESENSPKRQYESLKSQIQQSREYLAAQWEVLQRLHDDAVALAAARRVSVAVEPEPHAAPASRDEALSRFDAASLAAQEHFGRLQRQMLPRLFSGWAFLLIGLAGWAAVFAAAYFVVDPALLGLGGAGASARVLVSGGAGLIVCVVALLVTFGIAARQTRSAAEPLILAVTEAHACRQDWQRLAKDDLQQRERDFQERYAAIVAHREGALEKFAATRAERLAELETERDQGLGGGGGKGRGTPAGSSAPLLSGARRSCKRARKGEIATCALSTRLFAAGLPLCRHDSKPSAIGSRRRRTRGRANARSGRPRSGMRSPTTGSKSLPGWPAAVPSCRRRAGGSHRTGIRSPAPAGLQRTRFRPASALVTTDSISERCRAGFRRTSGSRQRRRSSRCRLFCRFLTIRRCCSRPPARGARRRFPSSRSPCCGCSRRCRRGRCGSRSSIRWAWARTSPPSCTWRTSTTC